jgi:Predicted membrane protein
VAARPRDPSPTQPGTRGQAEGGAAPASSLSLTQRLLAWVREFIQFGMVGATAYIVDAGLFNLLQHGPLGFLAGHPNTAQFVAAATATLYSWIANRLWTYRGRTRENATREAILFFFANACGIGISQFCLLFTHHILGFASALADNIAVYVVGFALGTAFRFFFYHYVVFTGHTRA